MEGIKGLTGGANNSFYWSIIFLVVLFVIAFVVALFIREDNARFGVDLKEPQAPAQVT
jgi:hypothetical protein